MIGKRIGPYEITGELGAGGMGVVYRARDDRLHRDVALKFLQPGSADGDRRFLAEARSLAALDHPNICTVYDLGEDRGRTFIAMAVVEGRTLAEMIGNGPLEVDRAADLVGDVARGLAYAHDQGIVHRDVKSGNIMVTPEGAVKILDFGLARSDAGGSHTLPGTVLGTPACMSPEQARGEEVDARTDVWALGVLLYEMLRGRPPFAAEFPQAVIYRIMNEDPSPLSEFRSDVPTALSDLIGRALARDPAARPADAAAFLADLDAVRTRQGGGPAAGPGSGAVAVLEFRNISGNPDDGWLGGGIAETIMVDLKRIEKLNVVPRDRVDRALEAVEDETGRLEAAAVGVTVGAAWVIWGGYQKMGEAIRITAHSSAAVTGEVLHSVKIDGSMSDIFSLQDRVVDELVSSLGVQVSDAERDLIKRPGTGQEQAYEYYARGRQIYNRGEMADVAEVHRLFTQALEIDPGYALACSGLASIHLVKFISGTDPADLDEGIRLAEKAIALDPNLADPYAWLTYFLHRKGQDAAAVAAGRRAVALEGNNGVAHYFLAAALVNRPHDVYDRDRFVEGAAALKACLRYSPHYQAASMMLGWVYMLHGQYDQASPHVEHAAELERSELQWGFKKVGGLTMLGNLRIRQGRPDVAGDLYRASLEFMDSCQHVYRETFRAQTYGGLGDVAFAAGAFDEALRHYHQAIEHAEAHPEKLGIGFFLVRGLAGAARSYDALGVNREARDHLGRARALLAEPAGFDFLAMWEGNFAQANVEAARACATLGDQDDALAHLQEAFRLGYRNGPEMDRDTAFDRLAASPAYRRLREELARQDPLP